MLQDINRNSLNYIAVLDDVSAKKVVFSAVAEFVAADRPFTSRTIVNVIRSAGIPVSHDSVTYYLRKLGDTLPGYDSKLVVLGGANVIVYKPTDTDEDDYEFLNAPEAPNPHIDLADFDTQPQS